MYQQVNKTRCKSHLQVREGFLTRYHIRSRTVEPKVNNILHNVTRETEDHLNTTACGPAEYYHKSDRYVKL